MPAAATVTEGTVTAAAAAVVVMVVVQILEVPTGVRIFTFPQSSVKLPDLPHIFHNRET